MTAHMMQEAIPGSLVKWSQWAAALQKPDEFNANRFGEINGRLAVLRAHIKHHHITDPFVVSTMLLPIDDELEDWKNKLPEHWNPKSYYRVPTNPLQPITHYLDSYYEVYSDLWVASMWNNYRVVRILIHETIMFITMKYGTPEQISALQFSVKILRDMTNSVCRSVVFHLGFHNSTTPNSSTSVGLHMTDNSAIPGGYLLAWPLYLSGMLRTTPREQKLWMASQMDFIATTMGLRLAHSFAETLRMPDNKSFSDADIVFIGEFSPQ
jgi:hypothetical protein